MEAVSQSPFDGMPERVAETDRGTPVYLLQDELPEGLLPKRHRGIGTPTPDGPFAKWLAEKYPKPSCVIVRYGRSVKIFKLGERGDVFPITARSIKLEDRRRLVEAGILNKS